MKTTIFALILSLIGTQLTAQLGFGDADITDSTKVNSRFELAIKLVPTAGGELYHFAVAEKLFDNKYDYQQISHLEFLRMATGNMRIDPSTPRKNYLESFAIDTSNKHWDPLNNLWRLRYSGHPHDPNDNSGWFMPNPRYLYTKAEIEKHPYLLHRIDSMTVIYNRQRAMLKKFGITKFSHYIHANNLFGLLRSMQSIDWIQNYVQAPLPQDIIIPVTLRQIAPISETVRNDPSFDAKKAKKAEQPLTIQRVNTSGWDQLTKGPTTGRKLKPKRKPIKKP